MKKRFLSLILVLAMMVGVFTPLIANAAEPTLPVLTSGKFKAEDISETVPETTKITIRKLKTDKLNISKAIEHNGGEIDFENHLKALGTNVEGLNGVKFTYFNVTKEQFEEMKKSPKNYDTVAKVKAKYSTLQGKETGETATVEGQKGFVDVSISKADYGYYWFVESGYKKDESDKTAPDSISESLAVPFGITLPLTNITDIIVGQKEYKAGSVYLKNVHAYPKNLVSKKVQIDKNFIKSKVGNMTDAELARFKAEALAGGMKEDTFNALQADILKYEADKEKVALTVGTKAPYDVVTKIPQNNTYDSMSWSDIMTKGLTFNNDLKVTVSQTGQEDKTYDFTNAATVEGATYTQGSYGFDLTFNEKQAIMNDIKAKVKNGDVTVRLQYSATVNNKTVVDKPEDNKISFTPGKPNPGQKVKPSNGEINVEKSWVDKDGKVLETVPEGVEVTYFLVNSKNEVVDTATVNKAPYSHKFTLKTDDTSEYTVREIVKGYEASYTTGRAGNVKVTNKNKPDVLVPTNPKVTTGGKKFVKVDKDGNNDRLAGAEFIIQNKSTVANDADKDKYLKLTTKDSAAYDKAQKAYDDAIDAVNKALAKGEISETNIVTIGTETFNTKADALEKIKALQKTRDDEFKNANLGYTWVATKNEATKFYTNQYGQFEVKGLAYSDYQAVETKAPVGYALPENGGKFTFKVKEGSYAEDANGLDYKQDENKNDGKGMKIENMKLTIPQTGGIGTIIFTAIGLAIMASAVIAIKKRQATEAR